MRHLGPYRIYRNGVGRKSDISIELVSRRLPCDYHTSETTAKAPWIIQASIRPPGMNRTGDLQFIKTLNMFSDAEAQNARVFGAAI